MFKENKKLKNIFFAGFLLSLHLALTAYVNSSFKIISEISWNEFGTQRTVESTDIITNWR